MATDASSPPRSVLDWGPHLWNRVLFPGEADTRTRVRPLSLAECFVDDGQLSVEPPPATSKVRVANDN